MTLDQAIMLLSVIALLLSVPARAGFLPALAVILSLLFNSALLEIEFYPNFWESLSLWTVLFSAKDLLLLTLLGFRQNSRELIILLSFAVSCLFHQAILAQVLTYEAKNLTLFAIRPQVMMYVSVAQLATVFYIILTGSGINGGKRKCAKRHIFGVDYNFHRVLHVQAFKVKR